MVSHCSLRYRPLYQLLDPEELLLRSVIASCSNGDIERLERTSITDCSVDQRKSFWLSDHDQDVGVTVYSKPATSSESASFSGHAPQMRWVAAGVRASKPAPDSNTILHAFSYGLDWDVSVIHHFWVTTLRTAVLTVDDEEVLKLNPDTSVPLIVSVVASQVAIELREQGTNRRIARELVDPEGR